METKTKRGLAAVATLAVIGAATCSYERKKFDGFASKLPAAELNIAQVEGADTFRRFVSISVSGPQPETFGIEVETLQGNRRRITAYPQWRYDGLTESLRIKKGRPDAEPITLIMQGEQPVELQMRSHWRIGRYNWNELPKQHGRAVVSITNAFHTPVVAGATPEVVDSLHRGGLNTRVFGIVEGWARVVGGWSESRSFVPMRAFETNVVPTAGHPALTQPVFTDSQ